jgi:hypothetical protein
VTARYARLDLATRARKRGRLPRALFVSTLNSRRLLSHDPAPLSPSPIPMSLWMAAEKFSATARESPVLPAYISRHMRLGFDSDDVAALLSSIDSSQEPGSSRLPHLPAEILFQILDFVPIDYLLKWRLVCRGFRDAIDGPVLYDCLQRAEMICYLGPPGQYPLNRLR